MTNSNDTEVIRLQRYLARAGVDSRRHCEEYILSGRVVVNGLVVTKLGTKVDPTIDRVEVDGKRISISQNYQTLMLHKPKGYVSSMKPQSALPIVADLLPVSDFPGLYPLGRLDTDTTGLLLFSTDGNLGQMLLHPSHHVSKTYRVVITGWLSVDERLCLERGVELYRKIDGKRVSDGITAPAQLEIIEIGKRGGKRFSDVQITVHEGKYHQIKRMFGALGKTVESLHRQSFGSVDLGDLPVGSWRMLTQEEDEALRAC